jgi:hypothetical protein
MTDLVFATMAGTTAAARDAMLLARSIRAFAGRHAAAPIWLLIPEYIERLPTSLRVDLDRIKVRLLAFEVSQAELDFPFAGKTLAAGFAEHLAMDRASILVWMDRDSLVIQEPAPLTLPDGKVFGYRPVDHTLIGSPVAKPIDPFWSLIYNYCGLDSRPVTPMRTSVDEQTMRPYFNAGMLVVRPQQKLLQAWAENFKSFYTLPAFTPFYGQDFLYRLFFHQAVLAGTILAQTEDDARQELPPLVNYPLHMHAAYPASRRPARLNDVITFRYDTLAEEPHWEQIIPIDEPLKRWLIEQRKDLNLI